MKAFKCSDCAGAVFESVRSKLRSGKYECERTKIKSKQIISDRSDDAETAGTSSLYSRCQRVVINYQVVRGS